jgi:hypothetical protein
MQKYRWTHAEFEMMSWHDNHVHALRITEGEHGAGTLSLDIDYILEWMTSDNQAHRFRIIPATLEFQGVFGLQIEIDYKKPTAATTPFSIDRIERTVDKRDRYDAILWTIALNWPEGEISFQASGFEQRGKGDPVFSDQQYLSGTSRPD